MDFETIREALRPLDAAYRDHYRATAEECLNEATDRDDLHDRIHESIDSSWWITYTWPAQIVLLLSDRSEEYKEMGFTEPSWETMAFFAMRADAMEYAEILLQSRKCDSCGQYVFGPLPERPEADPGERVLLYCDACADEPSWGLVGPTDMGGPGGR